MYRYVRKKFIVILYCFESIFCLTITNHAHTVSVSIRHTPVYSIYLVSISCKGVSGHVVSRDTSLMATLPLVGASIVPFRLNRRRDFVLQ